ncbi:MAG: hypothetical protein QOF45_2413 [Gaiellaceae bacterium]|jgi:hypothetical protein|nr:hypothetical protein [Gaiellaceae bacterium]
MTAPTVPTAVQNSSVWCDQSGIERASILRRAYEGFDALSTFRSFSQT